MLGVHPIWSGSSTQTIISLSSGEAEFYGAVKAACRLLGLKSLLYDLGVELPADLVTDSTACKGIASRRGAGNVRHIQWLRRTALWLRQVVPRRGRTIVKKVGKLLKSNIVYCPVQEKVTEVLPSRFHLVITWQHLRTHPSSARFVLQSVVKL